MTTRARRIVVLDGHTLNPGDLDWAPLAALAESFEVHARSAPAEVVVRAAGADVVMTNKTPLTREQIAALPALRYIGVLATGYNIVDGAAARERGIPVTNVPAYGTRSVAQMTFALILELAQHVGEHAASVRAGRWQACPDFCYWERPLVELEGLTLGIVGLGRIGRAVADLGKAFGMNVVACSTTPKADVAGIEQVTLDEVFRRGDVVSLHCPLTEQTRDLVNRTRIEMMKTTAFLINTSRGPLIDEAALAAALQRGRIAGAAMDVLSTEPPRTGNPLIGARNCLVTPHIAWATAGARARLLETAIGNVRAFLANQPRHIVN